MKNDQLNVSLISRDCKRGLYKTPKCDVLDLEVQNNIAGIVSGSNYTGTETYSSKGVDSNFDEEYDENE